uniref:Uncharacterized protein n=1 Tax=Leptobrachium leishanense TaxID=445787 RepID=A0A8C5PG60_9ANUR
MHRSAFQDRQMREVTAENVELKKFHEQMKKELRIILGRRDPANIPVIEDSSGIGRRGGVGRARASRTGDFGFTGTLKKQWNSLKQLLESLEIQASAAQANVTHVISVTDHEKELTSLRKETEELRQELGRSRDLIRQQQELLQEQMFPKPGEGQVSPLWDAYFLEEQLRLQQDRAIFEEQKWAFQDEREKFTEAAIRLGRERLQFQADQALFVQQQFLNMTPGLETPSWKRTPPWSSVATGTPRAPSSKNCTPNWSSRSKKFNDPVTPSTAELYRVLRLAPPSRSVLMSQRQERKFQRSDSDTEETRSDGLSLTESPEPEVLPPSAGSVKLSMTPYLCPRPTPLSSIPRHLDPTPGTAGLYRILGMTSTGRHKRRALRKSMLEEGYTGTPSIFCHDASRKVETACDGNHVRTGTSYETDSLYSGDSPAFEGDTYKIDGCEVVERDSLYKDSPLQVRKTMHSEEHFRPGKGSLHCNGVPQLYISDYRDNDHFWYSNERSNVASESCRSYSSVDRHPSEGYMEGLHSGMHEDIKGKDNVTREDWFPTQNNEVHQHRNISSPQESHQLRSSGRSRSTQTQHPENCSGNRSRETLHPQDYCNRNRRASCHEKNSMFSSGHRPSSHYSRRSCPSSRDSRMCWSTGFSQSDLRADLLNQFLDCST